MINSNKLNIGNRINHLMVKMENKFEEAMNNHICESFDPYRKENRELYEKYCKLNPSRLDKHKALDKINQLPLDKRAKLLANLVIFSYRTSDSYFSAANDYGSDGGSNCFAGLEKDAPREFLKLRKNFNEIVEEGNTLNFEDYASIAINRNYFYKRTFCDTLTTAVKDLINFEHYKKNSPRTAGLEAMALVISEKHNPELRERAVLGVVRDMVPTPSKEEFNTTIKENFFAIL